MTDRRREEEGALLWVVLCYVVLWWACRLIYPSRLPVCLSVRLLMAFCYVSFSRRAVLSLCPFFSEGAAGRCIALQASSDPMHRTADETERRRRVWSRTALLPVCRIVLSWLSLPWYTVCVVGVCGGKFVCCVVLRMW